MLNVSQVLCKIRNKKRKRTFDSSIFFAPTWTLLLIKLFQRTMVTAGWYFWLILNVTWMTFRRKGYKLKRATWPFLWALVEVLFFLKGLLVSRRGGEMATLHEKKTCSQRMENFQRFLWNPDTGQLMGRTLINWGMWSWTYKKDRMLAILCSWKLLVFKAIIKYKIWWLICLIKGKKFSYQDDTRLIKLSSILKPILQVQVSSWFIGH